VESIDAIRQHGQRKSNGDFSASSATQSPLRF